MPKFNTETEVKTSTPVSHKIAVGIMMIGALSAAMGIVMGLPVFKEKKVIGAQAFKPLQLTDGVPSTNEIKDSRYAQYQFLRDSVVMATYNYSNDSAFQENKNFKIGDKDSLNSFFIKEASAQTTFSIEDITNGSFEPGDTIDSNSKSPLQVKITQSEIDSAEIPAITFSLVTDIGNKTLCLPSNTINQGSVVSYYFDVDGTPYLDSNLKNKAMNSTCQVNSIAYDPTTISEINFNEPYPESIADSFAIYFIRYDQSMFAMADNTFVKMTPDDEIDFVDGGKAPFTLGPGYYGAPEEITVPARIYTVDSNLGTQTLCLPEQTITGEWNENDQKYLGKGTPYYYDQNGTPYTDVLLTNMATTKPCHELLKDSLTPYYISEASLSDTIDEYSNIKFKRDNTELGVLYINNNQYSRNFDDSLNPESKSPLLLAMETANLSEDVTFPARTITLKNANYDETEYTNTLCFPETTTSNGETIKYYYDQNGTPYTDVLLTNMATTKPCHELLKDSLTPYYISEASLSDTIDEYSNIKFKRDNTELGVLYINNNQYSRNFDDSLNPESKSPLLLAMETANLSEDVTFPARTITLKNANYDETEYTNTLCFPETTTSNGETIKYYYDQNGTPYTDVLLTNMATTKPCHELLANVFKPEGINEARLDEIVSTPTKIKFIRENTVLNYLWSHQDPSFQDPDFEDLETVSGGSSPLMLKLSSLLAQTFPERLVQIKALENNKEYTKTLCIPETEITENGTKEYFYDNNGSLYAYTDALLTNRIICDTCIHNPPEVSISPLTKSGYAGDSFSYSISVTNPNNPEICPRSEIYTFYLQEPAGWEANYDLDTLYDPPALRVEPGETKEISMTLISPDNISSGDYEVRVNLTNWVAISGSGYAEVTISPTPKNSDDKEIMVE
ncbi:MAG: hypothetical protein U5L76_05380 [Patescibacteria group bacterium]|nr:hypothetical protein [Patescibacteria group bacterium]